MPLNTKHLFLISRELGINLSYSARQPMLATAAQRRAGRTRGGKGAAGQRSCALPIGNERNRNAGRKPKDTLEGRHKCVGLLLRQIWRCSSSTPDPCGAFANSGIESKVPCVAPRHSAPRPASSATNGRSPRCFPTRPRIELKMPAFFGSDEFDCCECGRHIFGRGTRRLRGRIRRRRAMIAANDAGANEPRHAPSSCHRIFPTGVMDRALIVHLDSRRGCSTAVSKPAVLKLSDRPQSNA
jgi:hypothetical protein